MSGERNFVVKRVYLRFPGFKSKAVTISYDDGVKGDRKLVEIMNENGLKGTFNLNSGLFSKKFKNDNFIIERMSVDDALSLYADFEIAIHGHKHARWANINFVELIKEIKTDRIKLEKIFNKMIIGCAYPFGSYNDDIKKVLINHGIKYSRTVLPTNNFELPVDFLCWNPTCHHSEPSLIQLAKKFVKSNDEAHRCQPKVFFVWGHSYEFEIFNNWHVFERFAKFIGGKENIWYATNGQIYEYVHAYDSLIWGCCENYVYNPTSTQIYIDYYGNQFLLKSGETVYLK